jgi:hypothetical protein
MVDVVDVTMSGFGPASWSLAVSVAGGDGPALAGTPHSGFPSHIQDFGVGSVDDAGYGTVTGDHPQSGDVDDYAVFGFVKATGDTLECVQVGVDDDMGFLPAHHWGGPVVQSVPGEIV